jgi:hypothetical protein
MASESTPLRQPRSDDKAERMIIVRGPGSKPGAVRAAKMAEICEFCEHRSPPFPRPAVGRRANNGPAKAGGLFPRERLRRERFHAVAMTSSRALRSEDHRSWYYPLFLPLRVAECDQEPFEIPASVAVYPSGYARWDTPCPMQGRMSTVSHTKPCVLRTSCMDVHLRCTQQSGR